MQVSYLLSPLFHHGEQPSAVSFLKILDRGRNRQHPPANQLLLVGLDSDTERTEAICLGINFPTTTSSDICRIDVCYRSIVLSGAIGLLIVQTIVLLSSRFSATCQRQVVGKSLKPVAKSGDDHILELVRSKVYGRFSRLNFSQQGLG